MSCGVGCRRSSDPALLWLWCRPAAVALIRPLAWEPPYAVDVALKTQKDQKKKKKKKKRKKERKKEKQKAANCAEKHEETQKQKSERWMWCLLRPPMNLKSVLWSSLVVQWAKDPVLSLLWLG